MTKFISIDSGFLEKELEVAFLAILNKVVRDNMSPGALPVKPESERLNWLVSSTDEDEAADMEAEREAKKIYPELSPEVIAAPEPPPEDYTPSGGNWFVAGNGEVRKMDPHKTPLWRETDREQALAAGRLFETEEQAQTAAKLQGNFMRFIRRQIDDHPAATEINFSFNFLSKEP
jgi:hypothetical protein